MNVICEVPVSLGRPAISNLVVSLLVTFTARPPTGAAGEMVIVTGVSRFLPTETLGMEILRVKTVTLAFAGAIFGALAVIVPVLLPVPVTGTVTLVAPDPNVTVLGTTIAALFELKLIVKPVSGAFPPTKFRVRLAGVPVSKTSGDPEKEIVGGATEIVPVAVAKFEPDAVMVAEPRPAPVTCAGIAAVVEPCRMVTLAGATVTFDVSLLDRFTMMFVGAGEDRVNANGADRPRPTDPLPTVSVKGDETFTVAVAFVAMPGALAVIVAVPAVEPAVTGT